MRQPHTSSRKSFPTKSTNATDAATLAAGFIISIMTIGCFIAVIANPNFRH
jgi:nucleoside recognition membrane protein YjiH